MATRKLPTDAAIRELRTWGLATFPGAHTKSPWPGHLDLAVNDKTFAYLSIEGDPFSVSCKLPRSSEKALMLPGVVPTAYGLGKSGWVSAQFAAGQIPPLGLLKDWIEESYRAQAPKKQVAALDARTGADAPQATAAPREKAAPRKADRRRRATLKGGTQKGSGRALG